MKVLTVIAFAIVLIAAGLFAGGDIAVALHDQYWKTAVETSPFQMPLYMAIAALAHIPQLASFVTQHGQPHWFANAAQAVTHGRTHAWAWYTQNAKDIPWRDSLTGSGAGLVAAIITTIIGSFYYLDDDQEKKKPKKKNQGNIGTTWKIGRLPVAKDDEIMHTLCVGTTKTGKSQVIRSAAMTARNRGEPAIVIDRNAELMSRLYDPERDRMIAAYDGRSVSWSPLAEIEGEEDCDRVAAAMVPISSGGESASWERRARSFISAVLLACLRLHEQGEEVTNSTLVKFATANDHSDLLELIGDDHPFKGTLDNPAKSMVGSITGTASSKIEPLRALDMDAGFEGYSIREHVKIAADSDNWLFVPVPETIEEQAAPLASLVAGFFVDSLFETGEDEDRRYWLFVDEFGQYDAISKLSKALTMGRKFGIAAVCTLQTMSQLETAYGQQGANTLLSCFNTRVLFKSPDDETFDWESKQIGDKEVVRWTESQSPGDWGSTNVSSSQQINVERAVLGSQIRDMRPLTAYVLMPSRKGAYLEKIDYVDIGKPTINVFERRKRKPQKQTEPNPDPEEQNAEGGNEATEPEPEHNKPAEQSEPQPDPETETKEQSDPEPEQPAQGNDTDEPAAEPEPVNEKPEQTEQADEPENRADEEKPEESESQPESNEIDNQDTEPESEPEPEDNEPAEESGPAPEPDQVDNNEPEKPVEPANNTDTDEEPDPKPESESQTESKESKQNGLRNMSHLFEN